MIVPHQLIEQYALEPHPEGGWYKQTYRSTEQIGVDALPERFTGSRPFATAIYFLLEQGNFSAFHRIKSDGQLFQYVVPANCWFASRPAPHSEFCFTGCTVSPGFDFADFELADAGVLSKQYPQHETIIRDLCR